MIKIGSIGYNCSHPEDFVVDWKDGPGAYILLLVKTHSTFKLGQKDFDVRPGSVVVISPQTPTYYRAKRGQKYTDDWFYFDADGDGCKVLADLGIPVDTPTFIGAADFFSGLIYEITEEFYSSEQHHSEIVDRYTDIFFMRLGRTITSDALFWKNQSEQQRAELVKIKKRIHDDPASWQGVDNTAQELKMSVSNFEHLYKRAFGVSIMTDVVNSRMSCAKRLLMRSSKKISEIAKICGYNSDYSFMRQFKQKVGFTPTEFRKQSAYGQWSREDADGSMPEDMDI